MHTNIELSLNPNFMSSFLYVESCISLDMHSLQSLSKYQMLIIKVGKKRIIQDYIFIYLFYVIYCY